MSSQIMPERPEARPLGDGWRPSEEAAPSILREDELAWPRTVGGVGACLLLLVGAVLAVSRFWHVLNVSPSWVAFFTTAGLAGLLYHAAFEREEGLRRIYL